jgi:hypothetical protein
MQADQRPETVATAQPHLFLDRLLLTQAVAVAVAHQLAEQAAPEAGVTVERLLLAGLMARLTPEEEVVVDTAQVLAPAAPASSFFATQSLFRP